MARPTTMGRFLIRDFGTCYVVTGTQHAGRADNATLQPTSLTISCWINLTSNTGTQTFMRRWFNAGYIFRTDGSTHLQLQLRTNADKTLNGVTALTTGSWIHVVGTYNATTGLACLYINSRLDNSTTHTGGNITYNTSDSIYTGGYGFSENLKGKIDDLRIYNTDLTAAQVYELYSTHDVVGVSPVGFWKMDEGSGTTLLDSSGNGLNFTINSGSYSSDVKMVRTVANNRRFLGGTSLLFDSTDKVAVTSVAAQNNLSSASFAAWINLTGYGGGGFGRIFQKGNNNGVGYFDINVNNGTPNRIIFASDWDSTDVNIHFPIDNLVTRGWTHVIFTYDGGATAASSVKFYMNGSPIGASTTVSNGTSSRVADGTVLTIGNRNSDTARTTTGSIDEVQWFNAVLSDAQAAAVYRGETVAGRVGYWRFNEGSGSTATDDTGNANGVISGATYSSSVAQSRTLIT